MKEEKFRISHLKLSHSYDEYFIVINDKCYSLHQAMIYKEISNISKGKFLVNNLSGIEDKKIYKKIQLNIDSVSRSDFVAKKLFKLQKRLYKIADKYNLSHKKQTINEIYIFKNKVLQHLYETQVSIEAIPIQTKSTLKPKPKPSITKHIQVSTN